MVLLTMTQSIVDGLEKLDERQTKDRDGDDANCGRAEDGDEPALQDPSIGKPISHGQIVDLWKKLSSLDSPSPAYTLEQLLQGSRVYNPPPPPKPEPSDEYKALMARLRREEDARSYERMINPPALPETFQHLFPSAAHAFAEVNRPSTSADIGDDDVSFNEVHRQITLIINFLVSIAGVAATLWIAGRWWSVSSRLFLTLGGSILVAIAEVVVYSSYMWRMGEAKHKQAVVKEVKEVVQTWVVGDDGIQEEESILLDRKEDSKPSVRKRVAIPEKAATVL